MILGSGRSSGREWQPTPIFLPGKLPNKDYRPWGSKELNMAERLILILCLWKTLTCSLFPKLLIFLLFLQLPINLPHKLLAPHFCVLSNLCSSLCSFWFMHNTWRNKPKLIAIPNAYITMIFISYYYPRYCLSITDLYNNGHYFLIAYHNIGTELKILQMFFISPNFWSRGIIIFILHGRKQGLWQVNSFAQDYTNSDKSGLWIQVAWL